MNKELLEKSGYKVSKIIRDSLFNRPTDYKGILLYPITVDEFEKFNEEYANFILINHAYLNIPEEDDLLTALVIMSAYQSQSIKEKEDITEGGKYASRLIMDPLKRMQMEKEKKEQEEKGLSQGIKLKPEFVVQALNKFSEMLSFLMRTKVTPGTSGIGFDVWDKDNTSYKSIDTKDFTVIREIVLTQNALVEPIKYHDKLVDEWMQKARNARRRKDINFNDLIITVKNSTNLKYEEIAEMNMIQFYSDYRFVNHKNDYDASILFKTVSNKVPNIQFTTNITDMLFANNENELSMDASVMTNKLGDSN
jgi:hypothetical protein